MTDAVKLPTMPEPYRKSGQQMSYDGYDKAHCHLFSISQLHAYAIQAVIAERDRCAGLAHDWPAPTAGRIPLEIAAAIRAQPEPKA